MLRVKFSTIVPAAVVALGFAVSSYANEGGATEVVHERPIETRTYRSMGGGPVRAFAVQGTTLWYATNDALVTQATGGARNQNQQTFPRMGNISAAGITSIVIDPMGRIWVGTPEGVAVRVGTNFTSYTTENGLPDNNVLSIAAGSGGEVWVGTEKGAARFRDNSWTAFTTAEGLPGDRVQALAADSRGRIWFGTNRGAAVYNGTKFEVFDMRGRHFRNNNVKVLSVEPGTDAIWAAVGPRFAYRFDGKEWREYMDVADNITSIMNDTRRTWFGHSEGVTRFSEVGGWVRDPAMHGVQVQQAFSMHRDANGNLWFGKEDGVLWMNNPYRR